MTRTIILYCGLLICGLVVAAYDMPKGWMMGGSRPNAYEMGVDPTGGYNGGKAGTVRSLRKEVAGSGSLLQVFDAAKYKGKRLRMTGYLKTKKVDDWACLWMRVRSMNVEPQTGKEQYRTLAFDNMYNRSLKGDNDFTKCTIVLNVADSAAEIRFGAMLVGAGQIWFDRISFDIVGPDVPVTTSLLQGPDNLDFEK